MISREQENAIERMAGQHDGRLLVRHGYADQSIQLTSRSGSRWIVTEDGIIHGATFDNTHEWREFALEEA